MAQFDVYRNPGPDSRRIPFLLDVQSDLLAGVTTRVVVPLVRATEYMKPVRRLQPVFEVDGKALVMLTADLAGVSRLDLGMKIASLAGQRHEIMAALDFLFFGF
jgi:toxin CcdB